MTKFSSSKVGIVHKYHNHGTLLELVWTITPALILIAIAAPSFKLLYLMDFPSDTQPIYQCTVEMLTAIAITPKRKVSKSPVYLPVVPKTPVSKLYSPCTVLVPVGTLWSTGSTVGINYNDLTRKIAPFPKPIVSQLVGHLLGDGALSMSWSSVLPAFIFTQTLKRFEYVWSVFLNLSHYAVRYPSVGLSRGKYLFMQVHLRGYSYDANIVQAVLPTSQ